MRPILLFWLSLAGLLAHAQQDGDLQRFWYTDATVSYLNEQGNGAGYQEINLELYPAYALWPRLQIGPRFRRVFFRDHFPSSDWQGLFLAGVNVRGEAVSFGEQRGSLFLDLGFYRGNYCTCYDQPLYYRREGLWYLGWGLGSRWFPLKNYPHLGLIVAMNFHSVSREGLFRFDVYNFPHLGISLRHPR